MEKENKFGSKNLFWFGQDVVQVQSRSGLMLHSPGCCLLSTIGTFPGGWGNCESNTIYAQSNRN